MLWYKGWLETRLRLLFMLGIESALLALAYSRGVKAPAGLHRLIVDSTLLPGMLIPIVFAGAGIATQLPFRPTRGIQESIHFTLSLPVSRLRLLATRAGLGCLEMICAIGAWCCGIWILFPVLRATATAAELAEYAIAFAACASGLYCIAVLLSAFLDEELWLRIANMAAMGALWWLCNNISLPASLNVFRAMGNGSPLIAHSMPWAAMGVSLALAAVLFLAALKIAQAREY
jgi:hypothetical protein